MATSQTTGAPVRASSTVPLSADDVRAQVRDFVGGLIDQCVAERGGFAPVVALDALDAAADGVEDAVVARNAKGMTETTARADHRVGRLLGRDLDRLFRGRVEAAVERGEDPRQAVDRLRGLVATYVEDAAADAAHRPALKLVTH